MISAALYFNFVSETRDSNHFYDYSGIPTCVTENGGHNKSNSKTDDDLVDDDTDSLDIKPPQAIRRDSSSKRRSGKEKKHSKERKHKSDHREREERRERSDGTSNIGAGVGAGGVGGGGLTKYRDRDREMMIDDRRYMKHYERGRPMSHGQQRRDHHYVGEEYEYHNNRHKHREMYHHHHQQQYQQGPTRYDYHTQRKYIEQPIYDTRPDAELIEQDLRTRLLSKRHKYVKEYPSSHNHHEKRANHDYYRERDGAERKKETVIEVMDSPEQEYFSTKHKKKNKRRSPSDPELEARKAKLLEAEREMAKRKEAAREELEARRELRRERGEVDDSMEEKPHKSSLKRHRTAEEKALKRKRRKAEKNKAGDTEVLSDDSDDYSRNGDQDGDDDDEGDGEESDSSSNKSDEKRKKHRKGKVDPENSDVSSQNDDDDDDVDSDSGSSDDSDVESHKSYNGAVEKAKNKPKKKRLMSEEDGLLPEESPLSIGDLSKSPHKQKPNGSRSSSRSPTSSHGSKSHSKSGSYLDDDDDERRSRSNSRSHSHTRSRSRSRSHSLSQSRSGSSRSRSRSRSISRSKSLSRSRSRSEERNMKQYADEEEAHKHDKQLPIEEEDVPRNEKGEKLPNYFPGIQGCRSVEEFQCLNRIEEGTYGVVYRAKDKRTSEIVALKRLKMEKEKEGFPITSLREINTLLKGQHPNIVTVREIVVGSNMDRIFIVMDYVEHDLKSLMETMKHKEQSFFPGEIKCLIQQLLCAVGHLHDNWILHRDLKTSNLLLSHKGILKVGDFGLAREYGSPLKKYTSLVVTLWYRAPELLLCSPEYSTPIDIWSVGCIFGEFLQMQPLFPGKSEIDQLNRIFKELGTPNEKIWTGYKDLPAVKNLLSQNSQFTEYPVSNIRKRFMRRTTETGISLLQGLLTYDPKQRLTAEQALKHPYFKELPLPIDPSMFPTWPAKSELGARKALASSPKPPSGGSQFKQLGHDEIITTKSSGIISGNKKATSSNTGFVLNAGIDQRQLAMGPGFNLKF